MRLSLFFFNDTATTEIYTLSLHDALPIYAGPVGRPARVAHVEVALDDLRGLLGGEVDDPEAAELEVPVDRSEEHTSELQSPCNLVCRLLLEKKKKDWY